MFYMHNNLSQMYIIRFNAVCSNWCLRMDDTVIQGDLAINYENYDDEEAEFEREELERQNEVKHHFSITVVLCWHYSVSVFQFLFLTFVCSKVYTYSKCGKNCFKNMDGICYLIS